MTATPGSVHGTGVRGALPLGLVLVLLATGCASPPPPPLPGPVPAPTVNPADVDGVVFLLGDAGDALTETSPLLNRLTGEIEWWAQRLDAPETVAVLLLGDIVYPMGLNDRESRAYDGDTAVVMGQVRLVSGPAALARRARAYFMAGNHDWGFRPEWPGVERLRHLETFLATAREGTGAGVFVTPPAGLGGPTVVDVGDGVRLLLLDTAWWLLRGDPASRQEVLRGIDAAIASAGGRHIVLASHHPFTSAGPHGGQFSLWDAMGLRYLLFRSGAILQDLTSIPYREMEAGLRDIFSRHGRPLVFAAGHDHSLQVIAGIEATDPEFSLISGSGSKLTPVGSHPGLLAGFTAPGYMTLVFLKDGGVLLFVEATDAPYLHCPEEEDVRVRCLADGMAAFRTVDFRRLR